MHPSEVALRETLAFVQHYLLPGPQRLLEVGCGSGELAARLQKAGHHVIALDSDAAVIEQARQLGIDARVAVWPDFEEASFDAILFTRSLHHITDLPAAVSQAYRLLAPRGLLLVEDFAYETIDLRTSEWCYSLVVLLQACQVLLLKQGAFLAALLKREGELACWQEHHDHDLHSAHTQQAELSRVFKQVSESKMAYLYRYLLPGLPATEQGYTLAMHLVELEQRMGQAGGIQLIGRRYLARKSGENACSLHSGNPQ
ncbi:MAG: class I SAM-dependent methyltransferase [Ktedonobacteraceae bacterium]|nr:class I SAM-dependent methyltransferase [Ktedonobacteraceae bacterium]